MHARRKLRHRLVIMNFVVLAAVGLLAAPKPHLIAILADDLGWYDTAMTNTRSPTPNLKQLCSGGLRLDHHYVFRYCSPSRRSFLSGRFPNHITTVQPDGSNLCSDFLPLNLTILPEKLRGAGYVSHFVGKGHLGYETMDHLPVNRGFASHIGFLEGSESYSHGRTGTAARDLWQGLSPAVAAADAMYYSANAYTSAAVNLIEAHPKSRPLFLYFSVQNVHSPYTLPPSWEVRHFPQMPDQTYANMLHMLDEAVGNVTAALVRSQLWQASLVLFTADNGGIGRGNSYPLRGHKHDPWEGGTRATAFLAGGFLPPSVRGTATGAKLVHVSDWYPTFCKVCCTR